MKNWSWYNMRCKKWMWYENWWQYSMMWTGRSMYRIVCSEKALMSVSGSLWDFYRQRLCVTSGDGGLLDLFVFVKRYRPSVILINASSCLWRWTEKAILYDLKMVWNSTQLVLVCFRHEILYPWAFQAVVKAFSVFLIE